MQGATDSPAVFCVATQDELVSLNNAVATLSAANLRIDGMVRCKAWQRVFSEYGLDEC